MGADVSSNRPGALRLAETARPPRSGARLRTATVLPLAPLSVVERIQTAHFPCAQKGCGSDATEPALVPAVGTTLVVLLCEPCLVQLAPLGVRAVPTAKGQ
jgi:hypothetical protein